MTKYKAVYLKTFFEDDNKIYFITREYLAKYLGIPLRTLEYRKKRNPKIYEDMGYIVDYDLFKSKGYIKYKTSICINCKSEFSSSQIRGKYCKECINNKVGNKNRSKILSEKYKGKNNPNYCHGQSTEERYTKEYREWRENGIKEQKCCQISGRTDNLEAHHIFHYSVWKNKIYDPNNIIILNKFYHTELHIRKLDIKILPKLIDKENIKEIFLNDEDIKNLINLEYKEYGREFIFKHITKNMKKEIRKTLGDEIYEKIMNYNK